MLKYIKPSRLRELGIVGMNERNIRYIMENNPRKFFPVVDDKLKTKVAAQKHKIAVPELYAVVREQSQVRKLKDILAPYSEFVVKPANGSQGKGILVIVGKDGDSYLKPNGEKLSLLDMQRHVSNTLSGLYSLGGENDNAMVEALVHFTDAFKNFTYQGVPDIRLIVYKGYPIMAMMRLATSESDGKANLHQGAVGVGINLGNGKAVGAVSHNLPCLEHPDTGAKLSELVVPHWDEQILLASRCYEVTSLGYLGADIVIDKELGPLILELNARPGLSIQIANQEGLAHRRAKIDAHMAKNPNETPEQRVAFSKKSFAVDK